MGGRHDHDLTFILDTFDDKISISFSIQSESQCCIFFNEKEASYFIHVFSYGVYKWTMISW